MSSARFLVLRGAMRFEDPKRIGLSDAPVRLIPLKAFFSLCPEESDILVVSRSHWSLPMGKFCIFAQQAQMCLSLPVALQSMHWILSIPSIQYQDSLLRAKVVGVRGRV